MTTIAPITPVSQPYSTNVSAPKADTVQSTVTPTVIPNPTTYSSNPNPGIVFEAGNPKNAASLSASDIASSVSHYNQAQQTYSNIISSKGPMVINTENQTMIEQANKIYKEYQSLSGGDPAELSKLEIQYAQIAGYPPTPLIAPEDANGGKIKGNIDTLSGNNDPIKLQHMVNYTNQKLNQKITDFQNQYGIGQDVHKDLANSVSNIIANTK